MSAAHEPMRREWWILEKWSPEKVTIRNGMTDKVETVAQYYLTGLTIRNINKCDIGQAFERIYINGRG